MKSLLIVSLFTTLLFAGELPKGCEYDKECFFDLPGMVCADGTPSYFSLTPRKNAKNLLVYLQGGGGCWNKMTCENGMARPLTRIVTATNWENGIGIFNRNEPKNPFREDYDLVSVPYCTGDAFAGSRTTNYGTTEAPYIIRHQGFGNVTAVLKQLQAFYPTPDKVVLLGQSAGGMGTLIHAKSIDTFFPSAKKYVLDDSGVPLAPPIIPDRRYADLVQNWGIDVNFPAGKMPELKDYNFKSLIESNLRALPKVRFGLIGSYTDYIMTVFSLTLGAPNAFTAVRNTLLQTAKDLIGDSPSAKVYYLVSSEHVFTNQDIGKISSSNEILGDWMTSMVNDEARWTNIRPDLNRQVAPVNPKDFYKSMGRRYDLDSLQNLE